LVAVGEDGVHEVGVGNDVLADLEEGGVGVVLTEQREHLGRPARVGPVVECEGDHALIGLHAVDGALAAGRRGRRRLTGPKEGRDPESNHRGRRARRHHPKPSHGFRLRVGSGHMTAAERQAPDRNLAMELVRVTEAAALAASRWMGRGDKEGADGAAVDAMRVVLGTVAMDGIVVIGEGEKDEAPMLYNGENIGDGTPPSVDIAVDPIDGTTLTSLGRGNALSVIAMSERGTMFNPGPCVYMEKIAVGQDAAGAIDITQSPTDNLKSVAKALGRDVRDVTAVILDRDRHKDLIGEIRAAGARIRLIPD